MIQLGKEGGADCGGDVPVKSSISEIQRLKLITMTRRKLHVENAKLESETSPFEAQDLLVCLYNRSMDGHFLELRFTQEIVRGYLRSNLPRVLGVATLTS